MFTNMNITARINILYYTNTILNSFVLLKTRKRRVDVTNKLYVLLFEYVITDS